MTDREPSTSFILRQVVSGSIPRKFYNLTIVLDNDTDEINIECSCEGYVHRKVCKHLRSLAAEELTSEDMDVELDDGPDELIGHGEDALIALYRTLEV